MRPKSSASSVSNGLGGGVRKRPYPTGFHPTGRKVNAVKYQELVLNPIVRGLGKTMFNDRPFLFQQDGAPAHTAKVNQEWLKRIFQTSSPMRNGLFPAQISIRLLWSKIDRKCVLYEYRLLRNELQLRMGKSPAGKVACRCRVRPDGWSCHRN